MWRVLSTPYRLKSVVRPSIQRASTSITRRNALSSCQRCHLATSATPASASQLSSSYKKVTNENNTNKRRRKRKSEILFETTDKLLNSTSKWNMDDWKVAERSLHALTRQPKTTNQVIQLSFRLLDRMVVEAENNSMFHIPTQHLNIVLDKWRIGTRFNLATLKAPRVLSMIDNYRARIPSLQVDTKSYSLIMAVAIKQDPQRAPIFCTNILNRMKMNDDVSNPPPNSIVLTQLMDAHVKSQAKNSSAAVLAIFDYMVDSKDPSLEPSDKSLTRVLQALITSGMTSTQALPHMERILDYMLETSKVPNSLFLNLALSFCDNKDNKVHVRKRTSTAILADLLMTTVFERAKQYPQIKPNSDAYSTIIPLLAKSDFEDAPTRANHWLQEMITKSDNDKSISTPRASLYTSVIASYERSGLVDAPKHGESLFEQMMERAPGITAGSYYLLISLWSKSNLPEAPEKAEKLLQQMIDESRKDIRLYPSCQAFVNVISCWKRSSLPQIPYRAQGVLDLLLEEHSKQRPIKRDLNDAPFNATINVWAASGLPEAEDKVNTILIQMEEAAKTSPAATPSIVTAWSAMQCLSSTSNGASSKISKILDLMDNDEGKRNQHLRGRLYEHALLTLSQNNINKSAPMESERVLQRYLQEPFKNRNQSTSMKCFGYAMDTWKESQLPQATRQLESLLKQLEKEATISYNRSSNLDLYAYLAQAWAKSNHPNATEEVEQVLDAIVLKCKAQGLKINHVWFSKVMNALSEIGNAGYVRDFLKRMTSAYSHEFEASQMTEMYIVALKSLIRGNEKEVALEILEEIVDSYVNGEVNVKPYAQCFAPIMVAYAQSGDYEKVESIWQKLQQVCSKSDRDDKFLPDSTILSALCHCEPRNAVREYSILHGLLERSRDDKNSIPDEALVYSVLDSLVKSEDSSAGKRAEMILLKMQELYEEGLMVQPTFQAFQKVIDCWVFSGIEGATERAERVLHFAESLSEDGDNHLKPTREGYSSVIQAWSLSCTNDAPERIQRHIRKMQQRYENGERDFKLDEKIYSALIEAYANSDRKDATLMAQTVFDSVPSQQKRTSLYNALIKAQGGDAIRAESILNQMHEEFLGGNTDTEPNTQTFNNLIASWSKSGSPMAAWRADSIFQRMEELSTSGKLDVKPDGKTFDTVIATLSNDWGADAARKIDRYLDLIKEHYRSGKKDCMPSASSYTEAIRVWGSNVDDPRAVLRAKALFDEMHELASEGADSLKPNLETYLVYLKVLSQSEIDGKADLVKEVLTSMNHNGVEVDATLLSQIQRVSLPLGVIEASSWTVPIKDNEIKSL